MYKRQRLNTFSTDAEKESVISLQLMAGGPVTVADQYNTIGDNVRFYQNSELLALNTDRFVGRPLSDVLNDANNQVWTDVERRLHHWPFQPR